jgi:hypothetical protein
MKLLLLPSKRPKYRHDRPHSDFLTPLKNYAQSPNVLIEQLKESLVKQLYISDFDMNSWKEGPHRQSAHFIDL